MPDTPGGHRQGRMHERGMHPWRQPTLVTFLLLIIARITIGCPIMCTCTGKDKHILTDCRGRNLSGIPPDLGSFTKLLDLSQNHIHPISEDAFTSQEVPYIEKLSLGGNNLRDLPPKLFSAIMKLKELNLNGNAFEAVPIKAFEPLGSLETLHLENNFIRDVGIHPESLQPLINLQSLWLKNNLLTKVPPALVWCKSLRAVTLAENRITSITDSVFHTLDRLEILILNQNQISQISDRAFDGLVSLSVLELYGNNLSVIPRALSSLPNLTELVIFNNYIKEIKSYSFKGNEQLKVLDLLPNPIESYSSDAFLGLKCLKVLDISDVTTKEEYPILRGSKWLMRITLQRNRIRKLPKNICQETPNLARLDLQSNALTHLSNFSFCNRLVQLDLSDNMVVDLEDNQFQGLTDLQDLTLSFNNIREIRAATFTFLSRLKFLDLQHNGIVFLHSDAFLPLSNLHDLNLADNRFSNLPTSGLAQLWSLTTSGTLTLHDFPSPECFPNIQRLSLAYAHHCCKYIGAIEKSREKKVSDPSVTGIPILNLLSQSEPDFLINLSIAHQLQDINRTDAGMFLQEPPGPDYHAPPTLPSTGFLKPGHIQRKPLSFTCSPQPGPVVPCDSVLHWDQRTGTGILLMLSFFGNGIVLFVNAMTCRQDVLKFLIIQVTAADLLFTLYISIIAIVDLSTIGLYHQYGVWWQTSAGCVLAGACAVVSRVIFVFSLTILILERFSTVTYALRLEKRLSFKQTVYTTLIGWGLAAILAFLPVVGASDYRNNALCLPLYGKDAVSIGYICFLMLSTLVSLSVMVVCYLRTLCAAGRAPPWLEGEVGVVRRLGVLVCTNTLCLGPLSVLSLTALLWKPLLTQEQAKALMTLALPLNSCVNPILHVLFTAQFRKDWRRLCGRRRGTPPLRSPYSPHRAPRPPTFLSLLPALNFSREEPPPVSSRPLPSRPDSGYLLRGVAGAGPRGPAIDPGDGRGSGTVSDSSEEKPLCPDVISASDVIPPSELIFPDKRIITEFSYWPTTVISSETPRSRSFVGILPTNDRALPLRPTRSNNDLYLAIFPDFSTGKSHIPEQNTFKMSKGSGRQEPVSGQVVKMRQKKKSKNECTSGTTSNCICASCYTENAKRKGLLPGFPVDERRDILNERFSKTRTRCGTELSPTCRTEIDKNTNRSLEIVYAGNETVDIDSCYNACSEYRQEARKIRNGLQGNCSLQPKGYVLFLPEAKNKLV